MSASKKEKIESTPVEPKKTKPVKNNANVQDEIIKNLDKKFEKLAELEERLKKVESRLGL